MSPRLTHRQIAALRLVDASGGRWSAGLGGRPGSYYTGPGYGEPLHRQAATRLIELRLIQVHRADQYAREGSLALTDAGRAALAALPGEPAHA